ncbi:MAG TPA: aminotransferase class IV [Planctomycetota bacterium]|jgi:branched-chain amino acid aminotransferase
MHATLFSLNGRIVPQSEAVVPVTDRGLLYGDGLFETMHAYGGKIFRLPAHVQRLRNGMQHLFFEQQPSSKLLVKWLQQAVSTVAFPEGNVRLTVTRGSNARGPALSPDLKPTVIITVTEHLRDGDPRTKMGVRAVVADFRRQESSVLSGLKTLNYLEQILARREAQLLGADEALLLNNAGLLCEGSASNISLVRCNGDSDDVCLCIPDPKRAGALPGIAQITAMDAARNLGIPVCETCLSPWDLTRSQEAFLSGSMREISPLIQVGDTPVGDGKPGPVTRRIIAEYRRIVERECAPFKYA